MSPIRNLILLHNNPSGECNRIFIRKGHKNENHSAEKIEKGLWNNFWPGINLLKDFQAAAISVQLGNKSMVVI